MSADTNLIATWNPRTAKVGQPTPQTNPEMFTDKVLKAEARRLLKLNERLGSHPLRTATYVRLLKFIEDRKACKLWHLMDEKYNTPTNSPLHHDNRCKFCS